MLTFRLFVSIGLAFLCSVFATLPSAEVEALREIFQVAGLSWDGQESCGLPQVQCDKGNQTTESLILQSLKLTWLPESIGRLQALESLHLQDNQLRSLPESIAQLKSLAMLFLQDNQLTALPESMGQLQSLTYLNVVRNQLAVLPASLGQLPLRDLWLDDNDLTMLPDSFGQMKSLKNLYMRSNQVTSLPDSMGQLQQLVFLDLDGNHLTMLPESLTELQSLKYLLMASNQLMSLPDSIAALQSLRVFRLHSNKLTSLPETISQLQGLVNLDLHNNRLASLPESIGNLKALRILSLDSNRLDSLPKSIANLSLGSLYLDSNRLTSIPHLMSPDLLELRVAKNRLRVPPDLGEMTRLNVLSLHNNFLERLPPSPSLISLKHLKVALLHSNQIRDPTEICQLGQGLRLETLYLHSNKLRVIPPCLSQFKSLEVLTLHRNALTGEVPKSLLRLPNLGVLTLHGNRLYGRLPQELATAPKLFFFSAHSNRLEGPIPPLDLRKDCVNDESFLSDFDSCDDFTLRGLWALECASAEIALRCPKACGMCDNASARGPVLLLHNNRLSCSLPEQVTSWPKDIRSISLIGNMLGNGSHALPDWIHTDEHQPFLYISSNRSTEMLKQAFFMASICTLCWLLLVAHTGHGHIWMSKAGTQLTRKAHVFLFQMGGILSAVALFLLVLYCADATYHLCDSSFSSTTVGNFSSPYHGNARIEWAVIILWAVWVAVGAFFLRRAPTPRVAMVGETMSWLGYFLKFVYSCCWLCIVAVLSLPSVAYAVVSAIPHNNSMQLSAWWLQFFHYQAALVMVLVDMFITPKAVAFFADATGMRRSMLLMAARLGTMWLAAVLSTIYLTTHCMNGWTHLWKVCDDSTEDYKLFNISLGDNPILEPKADLCSAKESWWSDSACPRAVVNTMAPLLVSKMITRAFVQPIITLLRWQMSHPEGGQLYMLRGLICTSRSLEHGQQASLLVTWAEVALLWGAFVPILLPSVLLATGTNMLMCKVGHGHFGVEHVVWDKAATGMSRRYLHGSLCALVCFQNWFAWSSGMHGRWLLLLTALLYALELGGFLSFCPEQRRSRVAILDANPPDPPET